MKTNLRQLLLCAALAGLVPLSFAARADTPPAADKAASAPDAPAAAAPAAAPSTPAPSAGTTSPAAAPAAPSAPAVTPAPDSATPAPAAAATESSTDTSSLRRLDAPAAEAPQPAEGQPQGRHRHWVHTGSKNDRVSIGGDAILNAGETANAVVAIGGDAKSAGTVTDAVVAVAGNARATGSVSNAVVAVLGDAYVDGSVGQVVSVLGTIDLGPNAEVHGDVVCVGGQLNRDPKAIVHGNVPNVHFSLPHGLVDWAKAYFSNCVLKARPLAIAPHLGWAWAIALGLFGVYLLIALLFGRGIDQSITTLETRPGGSILAAVLTMLLSGVVFLLLLFTVIGAPLFILLLLCATLFGKAVMLAWLGRRVTRLFGDGPMSHPFFGVLIGGIIVLALYLVPVLGLLVYKLLGFLGLGVVVYTVLLASRKEKARAAAAAAAAGVAVPVANPAGATPMGAATEASGFAPTGVSTLAGAAVPPPMPDTPVPSATLPRAGFWIRIGALLIDLILVAIVLMFIPVIRFGPPSFLLVLAAYGAVLWKLKGTSIGGIVCGLRVVRVDGREFDWPTACVRALACFLSMFVAGLGFIWIAIDDDKQAWHDKIAGTVVVLVRGSQPLV